MPGLKPTSGRPRSPAPRATQAPCAAGMAASGCGRRRATFMPMPTVRTAATALRGGTRKRTREVIEIVPGAGGRDRAVYVERRCPHCGGRWLPGPELAGVVVGQGRFGGGAAQPDRVPARGAAAAHRGPSSAIWRRCMGLRSVWAAMVEALHTWRSGRWRWWPTSGSASAPVRCCTSMRRAGARTGTTATSGPSAPRRQRVFVHGRRDRGGAGRGDRHGLRRRAGQRLLRRLYQLRRDGTNTAGRICCAMSMSWSRSTRRTPRVRGWADGVHALYQRATAAAARPRPSARGGRRGRRARRRWTRVRAVSRGADGAAAGAVRTHRTSTCGELFVFVEDPAVPPTNNAAERSLRHLVTARKISGGTRSPAGTATTMTLATPLRHLARCRAWIPSPSAVPSSPLLKSEQLRMADYT